MSTSVTREQRGCPDSSRSSDVRSSTSMDVPSTLRVAVSPLQLPVLFSTALISSIGVGSDTKLVFGIPMTWSSDSKPNRSRNARFAEVMTWYSSPKAVGVTELSIARCRISSFCSACLRSSMSTAMPTSIWTSPLSSCAAQTERSAQNELPSRRRYCFSMRPTIWRPVRTSSIRRRLSSTHASTVNSVRSIEQSSASE